MSVDERRLMAAHTMPPMPGAHERRLAERTRSARLIRESISLLSSKWSVDIMLALGDGTRRYHELLEDLQPISEKVLTQTLRSMERDGVVARRVHAEVPPRVEYGLTSLGASLGGPMKALATWSLHHGRDVDSAVLVHQPLGLDHEARAQQMPRTRPGRTSRPGAPPARSPPVPSGRGVSRPAPLQKVELGGPFPPHAGCLSTRRGRP